MLGVVVCTALSILQIPKLSINPGFEEYIPGDVGNRAYMQQLDSIFGGNEKIMLILSNPHGVVNAATYSRLEQFADSLTQLEGIDNCMSLRDVIAVSYDDGFTNFDPLIREIPTDSVELHELEERLLSNEMGKRFLAEDLTATALILSKSSEISDPEVITSIKRVIASIPGDDEVYIGGLSYIRQSVKSYIKKDLVTLLPAALVLMVLMLYLSFREWKGVLLPFLVVVLSIVFSFGLMAVLGWEISLISVLLPIMLIAIANDYSIHLVNLYQEKVRFEGASDMKEIALAINRELRKPIVITALTTIGGMLGLLSHEMPPAAQLGVLASVGIALALALSLYLVPVLLTFYKQPKVKIAAVGSKKSLIDRVLAVLGKWSVSYPKQTLAGFVLVALLGVVGLFFLKVDTNVESYFLGKSDIKHGIDLVNKKFGGSQYVSVLFHGDVLSPEVLKRLETYTEEMKTIPEVGHVISPTIFLKELSKGMNAPGAPGYGQLPETEAEAIQYLELMGMSGFEGSVSQFIDYNYENARILVSMRDGSNHTGKKILKDLGRITQNDPNLVCIAGSGLSKIQIADMVIHGQVSSLILALLIIFVLLAIIFRSVSAGIKGSLPLLLSTLFLFGLMGFVSIPLDIVTALLSSIMIGVGVDYTIHFLWRYKAEYEFAQDRGVAIIKTLETAGRGIVFNAFSVIVGFSVLMFSSFAPLRFFGVLVVVSIFSCLICALLLIPAIIKLFNPRFLKS